ncbi:MAG: translation initiation factor IF-2 [Bryobacterales bacterium]|nr:translation initiation factor IF-2 [Bryobacterales bacterium]
MSKIRINVLARELEVKSHLILEVLPTLGVSEKLTHSSSVDDETAEKLRQHFGFGQDEGRERADAVEEPVDREPAVRDKAADAGREAEAPVEPSLNRGQPSREATAPPVEEEKPEEAPPVPEAPESSRPIVPIRPPLAVPGAPPAPPPSQQTGSPISGGPVIRPGTPIRPTIPVRPVPAGPRPGQVLSGPRQPLPSSATETGRAPVIPRTPGQPRPPVAPPPAQQATPGRPPVPPRPGAATPQQPRPAGTKPVLAGQPAQRPVVPPRPDLVARLTQPRMPQQPASPRPGVPLRQASPVPGQPIYKGPIRPGQPMIAKQAPRPGAPGRPGPRPTHPTSRLRVEPGEMPPPADGQRRPPDKRRQPGRTRQEPEERMQRHQSFRREAPQAPPPITREITVSEGITVKELSEKLEVKSSQLIKRMVDRGIFATINQTLDLKLAQDLARDFGASTATTTFEAEAMQVVEEAQVEGDLILRAPVVTIMGHVDHGKTSLLDAIREANVAGREAGGITQHIGAYHVELKGRQIVFIDTPGHEAFTRMRSRGAKVTDIVILVVAADDGVMPQTLEAIDHARAAKVPIIVAVNKIDKDDAQPDRVKQQLADRGLLAEDWGGDTVMVPVSAIKRTNLELLLEMILLVADMQDLKANPSRPGVGNVLEAKLDRGRGPVATVLVRNGILRVGDFFICGNVFGKVRAMLDDMGSPVREAGPSTPVEVLGLETLPEAGDLMQVVTDTAKAKQIVLFREAKARELQMSRTKRITLDQLHKQLREGEIKELPVILKTDVGGSAEVLTDTLQKLSSEKVGIRVIHSGVGAITESDVLLASASNAIIVGFNVRPDRNAQALAEHEKVEMRLHTIIYDLVDEIKRAMSGLLEPVYKETYQGKAEVRETFRVTKVGMVAGCFVQDGIITRNSSMRLLRDNVVVFSGRIGSLRRFKDDVPEVRSGMECGITIDNFGDVKQGDVIEAFVSERIQPALF